jgi:hypothetical protein
MHLLCSCHRRLFELPVCFCSPRLALSRRRRDLLAHQHGVDDGALGALCSAAQWGNSRPLPGQPPDKAVWAVRAKRTCHHAGCGAKHREGEGQREREGAPTVAALFEALICIVGRALCLCGPTNIDAPTRADMRVKHACRPGVPATVWQGWTGQPSVASAPLGRLLPQMNTTG